MYHLFCKKVVTLSDINKLYLARFARFLYYENTVLKHSNKVLIDFVRNIDHYSESIIL